MTGITNGVSAIRNINRGRNQKQALLKAAHRRLRLPNDTSIAAAARYRETFDRPSRVIPLNILPAWAERSGYRHVRARPPSVVIISTQLKTY